MIISQTSPEHDVELYDELMSPPSSPPSRLRIEESLLEIKEKMKCETYCPKSLEEHYRRVYKAALNIEKYLES